VDYLEVPVPVVLARGMSMVNRTLQNVDTDTALEFFTFVEPNFAAVNSTALLYQVASLRLPTALVQHG
jgi:hypothetical protein